MSSQTLSYQEFIQSLETVESAERIQCMAYISQMRRRNSNATSFYSNASAAASSTCTAHSNGSSTKLAVPSALDLDSAIYQKGYELRQYDSDEEFEFILQQGFNVAGNGADLMPTLKLTLTPEVLRKA